MPLYADYNSDQLFDIFNYHRGYVDFAEAEVIRGIVTEVNGFPDSLLIRVPERSYIYCYEVKIKCDNNILLLYMKFGRFPYFSYYIKEDSFLSLSDWYKVEESFVPIIGEEYIFDCINISNENILFSLADNSLVSGLLVVQKQKTE
jgi:hypothetical protein